MNQIKITSRRLLALQLFERFSNTQSVTDYRNSVVKAYSKRGALSSLNIKTNLLKKDFEKKYDIFSKEVGIPELFPADVTVSTLAHSYYVKDSYDSDKKICEGLAVIFYFNPSLARSAFEIIETERDEFMDYAIDAWDEGICISPAPPGGIEFFEKFSNAVGPFEEFADEVKTLPFPKNASEFVRLCWALDAVHLIDLLILKAEDILDTAQFMATLEKLAKNHK